MAFLDFLFGKPEETRQLPRYNPAQQQGFNQVLQQALSGLQQPKQQFDFAPIADQARTQFREVGVPSLAERFTSMGQGGQRSSAFQGALGRAESGLEGNLASLQSRIGLQQQGQDQNRLMRMLGMGLQPQFETLLSPHKPGMLESGQKQAMSMFMQILPMLMAL